MKKLEINKSYKTNFKKGISLIALVITIVIILIISATVIITTTQNNPIEQANEAVIKSDIRTMQEKYEMAYADIYMKYLGDESKIKDSDFSDIIPDEYNEHFKATVDGIIYVGDNEYIEKIAAEMGIEKKEYTIINDVIVTANQNSVEVEVIISSGEIVDEYIYKIREKDTDTWTEFSSTDTNLVIEGLTENKTYEIKVVVKQGDKTYESEIVEITTSKEEEIVLGTLTLKLNDANGETYTENTWTNQNVYVAVSGENTTYSVTGANTVTSTTASSILTNNGSSTVTLKTTSSTQTLTDTYTVKIDKTAPSITSLSASQPTNGKVTLTGKAKDTTSGIYAYQFTTDENLIATSTGWQTVESTTSEITKTYEVSENKKYYFYVKDNAENVTKQEIEVTSIDITAPTKNAPTLTSTTNSITATLNQTDEKGIDNTTIEYAIKKEADSTWGSWVSGSATYTFEQLDKGVSYQVKTKVSDKSGNESESEVATITTTEITKPRISYDNAWTNESVTVTIEYDDIAGTTRKYTTNGSNWITVTGTTQEVIVSTNNTTVTAQIMDSTNQKEEESVTISCIDTENPEITSFVVMDNTPVNTAVMLEAKAIDTQSGIVAYSFTEVDEQPSEWTEIEATQGEIVQYYNVSENKKYYFYVKDGVGNVEKAEVEVNNIDNAPPTITSLTKDIEETTNGNVVLTGKAIDQQSGITAYIFSTDNSITKDSTEWLTIATTTSEITQTKIVTENDTYYFYVKDEAGNVTKQEILVDNIDKTAPTLESLNVTAPESGEYPLGQEITIVATYSENIQEEVPDLNIKFGEGTEKTLTGTVENNTITYTYTIVEGDSGLLTLASYTGVVKDTVGNSLTLSNVTLTGNEITALDARLIVTSSASEVEFYEDLNDYLDVSLYLNGEEESLEPETKVISTPNWPETFVDGTETYSYTWEETFEGAESIEITFDSASALGYDYYLYVYDSEDNTIYSEYYGNEFAGQTYTVNGNYVRINICFYDYSDAIGFSAELKPTTTNNYTISPKQVPASEGDFDVTVTLNPEVYPDLNLSKTVTLTAIQPLPILTTGSNLYDFIPAETTSLVFTDEVAPEGTTLTDVSTKQNNSVVAWLDGTTYKVSSQRSGVKVIANEDMSYMLYGKARTDDYDYDRCYGKLATLDTIDFTNLDTSNTKNMSYMFLGYWDTDTIYGDEGDYYEVYDSPLKNIVWGDFDTSNVTNMKGMFTYNWGLTSLDVSSFDISKVTNMSNMFYDCRNLTNITYAGWDTGNVTDMSNMFYNCKSLTSLDVSNFDTSNVTDMSYMFYYSDVTSLDVSSFDTSNVTDMSYMFCDCSSLTSLDVSSFNTSNVTDMSNMFYNCKSLTSLDVGSFDTSNVTDMSGLFSYCSGLTTLDVRNFNTSKVTDMSSLFAGLKTENLNLSGWDTSKVTDMSSMFSGYKGTTNFNFTSLDTSNVTDMSWMFSGYDGTANFDFTTLDTSNVTDMSYMFYYSDVTSLDLSGFDTGNVTDMSYMFYFVNAENINVSNFNTSSVTDMSDMFSQCDSLTSLDLSSFNTSNVTDMSSMFYWSDTLTSINVSSFNTSNVTNMRNMFSLCSSLTSLDVSSFNTSNVTDMSSMFEDCESITSLDLSHFDTSKVKKLEAIFESCISLKSLDLSSWNTSSLTTLCYNSSNVSATSSWRSPFGNCTSLESINLSGWDVSKVTSLNSLFYGCTNLKTINLTGWDMSNVKYMPGMFYGCKNLTTEISILNTGVTSYDEMFYNAATVSPAQITVNYTADTSDLVDLMIATKSDTSNVVKGTEEEAPATASVLSLRDAVEYIEPEAANITVTVNKGSDVYINASEETGIDSLTIFDSAGNVVEEITVGGDTTYTGTVDIIDSGKYTIELLTTTNEVKTMTFEISS